MIRPNQPHNPGLAGSLGAKHPIFLILLLFVACEQEPTVLVGDVYLIEGMGTERSFSSIPVHLLPDEAKLDTLLLLTTCPNRNINARPDSAREAAAWAARNALLRANIRQSAITNSAASFTFDSVPDGNYRLWADTVLDGDHVTWMARVFVRGEDTLRANLDNDQIDEDPFRCFRRWRGPLMRDTTAPPDSTAAGSSF